MIPIDLPTIWAFIIAFAVFVYVVMDGFDLGLGILFPLFPEKARSRRHHEQRRAGLGRQRNLAGARRRRHDGGVSAGLCGADAGALHADDRDAARPGVPRRRLRIPLAHARGTQQVGHRLCRRIAAGDAGAGHCARRHPARHPCRGPAICRRLVGLADAVQHPDRRGAGDRLCAARRDMAGDEDGRRIARPRLSSELGAVARDARAPSARSALRRRSCMCSTRSAGSPGRTSS